MTLLQAYHVGILVADLDVAIEHFSTVLGVTFNPPTQLHFFRVDAGELQPGELRATYSREGPLHYELMEATGDDIYSLAQGEGFHHIGLWSPNPQQDIERLATAGVHPHVRLSGPDGVVGAWYSHRDALHGVRLELVDEAHREGIEGMIAGLGFPEYE